MSGQKRTLGHPSLGGTADSHHEVVWIVVWSCITGSYSVTDSTPIARSQLHYFQKHLSDVPEVGDKEKLVSRFKHVKRKKLEVTDDPHLLQVASRRIVSILWISSSICASPFSFHASSRTEPVSFEFRRHFQDITQPQS